jgi:hypothetical protein
VTLQSYLKKRTGEVLDVSAELAQMGAMNNISRKTVSFDGREVPYYRVFTNPASSLAFLKGFPGKVCDHGDRITACARCLLAAMNDVTGEEDHRRRKEDGRP